MNKIELSKKYKKFLKTESLVDILEGTTSAGKTTVGIVKFIFEVMKSPQKLHIISGRDLGVTEKNIINAELGLIEIFGSFAKYYQRGHAETTMPHVRLQTKDGVKIIYIIGYNDASKWQKVLGGQYGCVFIDEINIADMSYVTQIAMRADYLIATLNPDNPDKEIYRKFINRARPLPEYENDGPPQVLSELTEQMEPGWNYWFFSFDHNPWVTPARLKRIKAAHVQGTPEYNHYILGIRCKASGIIFFNFSQKHIISKDYAKEILKQKDRKKERFILFSAGLDTSYSQKSNDTIAMSFVGITSEGRLFVLDEEVYNNNSGEEVLAPSDVVIKFIEFLDKNKKEWGYAKDVFIDSADQATHSEFIKYRNKNGCEYVVNGSYKKITIDTRIRAQRQWIEHGFFYVLDHCETYIKEMNVYSYDEKEDGKPEDKNDHMINSVQYAFMAFMNRIGEFKV